MILVLARRAAKSSQMAGSVSSAVSRYSTVSSPAAACCASRAKASERSRAGGVKIAYVKMVTPFLRIAGPARVARAPGGIPGVHHAGTCGRGADGGRDHRTPQGVKDDVVAALVRLQQALGERRQVLGGHHRAGPQPQRGLPGRLVLD